MARAIAPTRTEWQAEAACRDADTAVFFPVSDNDAGPAREICANCPVAEQCLEWALEFRPSDGVFGGLTSIERHRLIRRRQKAERKSRKDAA